MRVKITYATTTVLRKRHNIYYRRIPNRYTVHYYQTNNKVWFFFLLPISNVIVTYSGRNHKPIYIIYIYIITAVTPNIGARIYNIYSDGP